MKRTIHLVLLVLVVILYAANYSLAQKSRGPHLEISGNFVNLPKTDTARRVLITYNTEDWFSRSGFRTVTARADTGGNFKFSLPDLGRPYKINVILRVAAGGQKYAGANQYYTEPGDDIHMRITLMPKGQSKADFTGKGSEKYQLAQAINDVYSNDYYAELGQLKLESLKDTAGLKVQLEKLAVIIEKFKDSKAAAINTARVNPAVKVLLGHEFARYDSDWAFRIESLLKAHPEWEGELAKNYLEHSRACCDKPDQLSVMCPTYLLGINAMIKLNLMVANHTVKVNMATMYDTVKNSCSGYLRDRLIGAFIFSRFLDPDFEPHTTELRDSIYRDAWATVQRPNIKQALSAYIADLAKITGQKGVIDAAFYDLNGKKVQLSSFKGKVLLIDAWFNGCAGCSEFHQVFEKEIYPLFKKNDRFVVLSINVDSDKGRWLSALKTGRYSSPGYIDLTTGDWFNGPFMKYYGVTAAPFLMLIDAKGIIRYQPRMAAPKEWINNIAAALEK